MELGLNLASSTRLSYLNLRVRQMSTKRARMRRRPGNSSASIYQTPRSSSSANARSPTYSPSRRQPTTTHTRPRTSSDALLQVPVRPSASLSLLLNAFVIKRNSAKVRQPKWSSSHPHASSPSRLPPSSMSSSILKESMT